jgi:predicted negative regulator of RcsB-dependent stress response
LRFITLLLTHVARTFEVLANLAATYSKDPRKRELFPLRAAEVQLDLGQYKKALPARW